MTGRKKAQRPLLTLTLPSETKYLGMVRDIASKMAQTSGFDESTAGRLALAVDEATTNVMEHAYKGDPDRKVELRFLDQADTFEVVILDSGPRVSRQSIPQLDPETLKEFARERKTGGLGVHLMGKIMDSVTYGRIDGRNACVLVKKKAEGG